MTIASLFSTIGFSKSGDTSTATYSYNSDSIGYYSTDLSHDETADESDSSSKDSNSTSSSYSSQSQGVWSTQSSYSGVVIQDELQHLYNNAKSLVGDTTSAILTSRVAADASAVFNEATNAFSGVVEDAAEAVEDAEAFDHLERILDDTSTAVNDATTAIQASSAYNEATSIISDIITEAANIADDEELEQFIVDATTAINQASISTLEHAASAINEATNTIQASDDDNASDVIFDVIDEAKSANFTEDVQVIIDQAITELDLLLDSENTDEQERIQKRNQKKMRWLRWIRRRKKAKQMTARQRMRANKKKLKRICDKWPDLGKEITEFHQLANTMEKATKDIIDSTNFIRKSKLKKLELRMKITALSEKYLELEAADLAPLVAESVGKVARTTYYQATYSFLHTVQYLLHTYYKPSLSKNNPTALQLQSTGTMAMASLFNAIGLTNKSEHVGSDTSTATYNSSIGYYSTDWSSDGSRDKYDLSSKGSSSSSYSSQSRGALSTQSSYSGVSIQDELVGDTTSAIRSSRVAAEASSVLNETKGSTTQAEILYHVDRKKIFNDMSTAFHDVTAIQASTSSADSIFADLSNEASSIADDDDLEQFIVDTTTAMNHSSIPTVKETETALNDTITEIQQVTESELVSSLIIDAAIQSKSNEEGEEIQSERTEGRKTLKVEGGVKFASETDNHVQP